MTGNVNHHKETDAALQNITRVLEAPPLSPLLEQTTTPTKQPTKPSTLEQTSETRKTAKRNKKECHPICGPSRKNLNQDASQQHQQAQTEIRKTALTITTTSDNDRSTESNNIHSGDYLITHCG